MSFCFCYNSATSVRGVKAKQCGVLCGVALPCLVLFSSLFFLFVSWPFSWSYHYNLNGGREITYSPLYHFKTPPHTCMMIHYSHTLRRRSLEGRGCVTQFPSMQGRFGRFVWGGESGLYACGVCGCDAKALSRLMSRFWHFLQASNGGHFCLAGKKTADGRE